MKLVYPAFIPQDYSWTTDPKLALMPTKNGEHSGFLIIGVAQSGIDLYVLFSNMERNTTYIEKTTTLNPHAKFIAFEILERIVDNGEFARVHQFFVNKGLLCGIKKE